MTPQDQMQTRLRRVSESMEDSYNNESIEQQPGATALGSMSNMVGSTSYPTYTPYMRDKLQRKLKYFFMNPLDKFRAKGRLPWKLCMQVIKIILVTLQLWIFGNDMARNINHQINMRTTFREIFLDGWDPTREVAAYPPASGPFAVYTVDDFFKKVNHAIFVFSNISDYAIGSFEYASNSSDVMSPITLRKRFFEYGDASPSIFWYNYSNTIIEKDIVIDNLYKPGDERWKQFRIEHYLDRVNETINFDRLLEFHVLFQLRTIYLNSLVAWDKPECYTVNVSISFDNSQHDGQMLINLKSASHTHPCRGSVLNPYRDQRSFVSRQIINWTVIIMCSISFVLCVRSIIRGQKLRKEACLFFKRYSGRDLGYEDQLQFVDFWIVMILANDVIILMGSALKIRLEQRLVEDPSYIPCSLLLGIGNLLVWAGLLRYLAFFHKYNVLILTLKRAFPHVMRFGLCAILLYGGFSFAGWVILGPFHMKFRELSTTSECLFALMNGDDMFATFTILETDSNWIWYFSRIYVYLFICLFIYVILSLFIAIIMDSYETIKDYYQNGFPMTPLQTFIAECPEESTSPYFQEERDNSIAQFFADCFAKCFPRRRDSYDSL